jgi:hypothetical protein
MVSWVRFYVWLWLCPSTWSNLRFLSPSLTLLDVFASVTKVYREQASYVY